MRRLIFGLWVALLVFATGCNSGDPIATQSWTDARIDAAVQNLAAQQKLKNDQFHHFDNSLKDGTAKLNVDSVKSKAVETADLAIEHGGSFTLRSGVKFHADDDVPLGKKPKPGPDPEMGALKKEIEALKVELRKRIEAEAAKKTDAEPDFVKIYEEFNKGIKKLVEGRDKHERMLEQIRELHRKSGEDLDKAVRPKPVMPPAKHEGHGGFPGGFPAESKLKLKLGELADARSADLIPIARQRLRQTEKDYGEVVFAMQQKAIEANMAPMRIRWPDLPNPYSPTVFL